MKKILKIAYICLLLAFVSCEKSSTLNPTGVGNICVECTEHYSGFVAPEFCGTPQEVDLYIKTLNDVQGQLWTCDRK